VVQHATVRSRSVLICVNTTEVYLVVSFLCKNQFLSQLNEGGNGPLSSYINIIKKVFSLFLGG